MEKSEGSYLDKRVDFLKPSSVTDISPENFTGKVNICSILPEDTQNHFQYRKARNIYKCMREEKIEYNKQGFTPEKLCVKKRKKKRTRQDLK